ncbi:uncharacterized protein LOC101744258 isoform X1 [Bombyx mori]|uniref:Generative cell specific-1/HAP2 domain-containing protein n=1 Tax=Bombyx mori TaxID=7091 RepID=A0A8R2APF6_BOMMO|nr:uncharacterized protein LOC101744258 isoform X1 [Bombyx mori]
MIQEMVLFLLLNSVQNFYVDCKDECTNADVEIKAVLINCKPNIENVHSERTKFQYDELFKYNVLQECEKKIGVSVKLHDCEPNYSVDEYVPVVQISDSSSGTYLRLLNPYVLRVQREVPLQAYKLRKLENVTVVMSQNVNIREVHRLRRYSEVFSPVIAEDLNILEYLKRKIDNNIRNNAINDNNIKTVHKRSGESNIVVEFETYDNQTKYVPSAKLKEQIIRKDDVFDKISPRNKYSSNEATKKIREKTSSYNIPFNLGQSKINKSSGERFFNHEYLLDDDHFHLKDYLNNINVHDFTLYAIGNPEIWKKVNLQLFEKRNTPEGKPVWNDITKGHHVSLSSVTPEWIGQDAAAKFKPIDFINRTEFTFSMENLCILIPMRMEIMKGTHRTYIIVSMDDIFYWENSARFMKRDNNSFPFRNASTLSSTKLQVQPMKPIRKVLIRPKKALIAIDKNQLNIVTQGPNEYLTLPFRKSYETEIDIEAKADENQVVLVGQFGRITAAISDASGIVRPTLFFQITNTGLTSSKFRVVLRECDTQLFDIKNLTQPDSILIPPRLTRLMKLELPDLQDVDRSTCSVDLVNHEDIPIAARRVVIKRGDRCFCIWFCECVCLADDAKLNCKKMREPRQAAAGLSRKDIALSRRPRSFCYNDNEAVNFIVTFLGVLITLLLLGLAKGFLGLFFPCIRSWGLDRILKSPRRLKHYYETSLRSRYVQYDADGWPIHPDTKKRTVYAESRSMEFTLNLIFFITIPCIVVCDILRQIIQKCIPQTEDDAEHTNQNDNNNNKNINHYTQARNFLDDCKNCNECTLNDMHPEESGDSEQDDTVFILMQLQKSKSSLHKYQATSKTIGFNHSVNEGI